MSTPHTVCCRYRRVDGTEYDWVGAVVGGVAPTVGFAVGFIPQFKIIVRSKSSEGISLGLVLCDLAGAVLTIASIVLTEPDAAAIAPYASIFFFQSILLAFRVCIFPPPKSIDMVVPINGAATMDGVVVK
eukprot:TRINITY_DN63493_c0_g1_i3.p2 TRINITY_DN63493_c0_g1~~TRINITY_DN63493_c0_g1_i3.p2  ORF type:complete len:130 (+),score=47.05 TRINITY_DN63493_c0_g1_i3:63-452(+)